MDLTLPVLAGTASTVVFAGSTLPMLHKALRTRELSSYSFGNIALANVGNAVHSVYVFNLPPGPIWFLHTFYVVSSALMLYWYLRSRPRPTRAGTSGPRVDPHPGLAVAACSQRGGAPSTDLPHPIGIASGGRLRVDPLDVREAQETRLAQLDSADGLVRASDPGVDHSGRGAEAIRVGPAVGGGDGGGLRSHDPPVSSIASM
jgi:hypothetical protein